LSVIISYLKRPILFNQFINSNTFHGTWMILMNLDEPKMGDTMDAISFS